MLCFANYVNFIFKQVSQEFSRMEPLCSLGVDKFKSNFEKLLSTLKKYLLTNHPLLAEGLGKSEPRESIDLLLSINQLCSSKRGVSASAPLFMNFEVIIHLTFKINRLHYFLNDFLIGKIID
jgi:hypothetical protein